MIVEQILYTFCYTRCHDSAVTYGDILNRVRILFQADPFQAGPFQAGPFQAGPFQAGPFQAGLPYVTIPCDLSSVDRWTTSKIRKRTKVRDVLKNIGKLKWNWTGRTMRTNKEKWTKDALERYPRNGKRKREGQIKRREDDLPKEWRRSTGDREKWQKLGEAYVDRQSD
ncbi:hypothetical protein EVAR_17048_1 [Eumeta japonica]|uniref:Uncharacterized protein n=1 Tax=Eumeta variegata TaxID=151549 RepID=A0A4C1V4K9_EUMVA|nr:hypothetical protein EVAR_17048_1 [Eumeta japonica]